MAGFPKANSPVIPYHFVAVLGEGEIWGWGGGGGDVASEISPLTEVAAAAAGDEPSGPTSERGNDGRRGSHLLQMGWLSSTILPFLAPAPLLRFPSYLEIVSIFW